MRWLIGLFCLGVFSTAAASIGLALWDGHFRHGDAAVRAIHYDTKYDLSAQRRMPADPASSRR